MSPDPSDIEDRLVEVADLALRPGTYFNPQTEVVVVVDDSTEIDQEIFNMEEYEGADWVRISDEVPIDEEARDDVIEEFQTSYHPAAVPAAAALDEFDEDTEGEEKPRPGHAAAESDEDDEDEDEEPEDEAPEDEG